MTMMMTKMLYTGMTVQPFVATLQPYLQSTSIWSRSCIAAQGPPPQKSLFLLKIIFLPPSIHT